MMRTMVHTQESRPQKLARPVLCKKEDAWLGDAYYFWYDAQDAFNWGNTSKRKYGYFEVYVAEIDCADVLDTVFNEDHYKFWVRMVEKAAKAIMKRTGQKPSIKSINNYFKERAQWKDVTGIMFQDIPQSETYVMVISLYYKKRIQLAVYNLSIIVSFVLQSQEKCV